MWSYPQQFFIVSRTQVEHNNQWIEAVFDPVSGILFETFVFSLLLATSWAKAILLLHLVRLQNIHTQGLDDKTPKINTNLLRYFVKPNTNCGHLNQKFKRIWLAVITFNAIREPQGAQREVYNWRNLNCKHKANCV